MTSGRRVVAAGLRAGAAAIVLLSGAAAPGGAQELRAAGGGGSDSVARGRYLVLVAGCNDCHTEQFPESGGSVPDSEWLTGSSLGFRGPWGTTYGTNLRLYAAHLTEDEWVEAARTVESRPPMPWWGMRAMSEPDLRAMYAFIRSLGPGGDPEPAYVPPGEEPRTAFVTFPEGPPAEPSE